MALTDYEFGARYCSRCSFCKWIPIDFVKSWEYAQCCPSISRHDFHAYSGGGRVVTALSLLEGRGEITDEVKESIYRCQLCGACQTSCHLITELVEPLEIARELKFRCIKEGKEVPALAEARATLRKTRNSLGKPQAQREEWAKGLNLKDATKEKVEVLFFAGCMLSLDESMRQVAKSSIKLLGKAGLDIGFLGAEEPCCGGRLFDMGYMDDLAGYAKNVMKKLKASGATVLVTPCACCYGSFMQIYPMMGHELEGIEVMHISELLSDMVENGKLKLRKSVPMQVTYHDPCHLGRLGEKYEPYEGTYTKTFGALWVAEPEKQIRRGTDGVYEPPRNILENIPGMTLKEMERNREFSWCCGAGGGVHEAYPDFAEWTANERIEEAIATGSDAIVTACPWCESNFKNAMKGKSGKTLEVFDLVEVARMAI